MPSPVLNYEPTRSLSPILTILNICLVTRSRMSRTTNAVSSASGLVIGTLLFRYARSSTLLVVLTLALFWDVIPTQRHLLTISSVTGLSHSVIRRLDSMGQFYNGWCNPCQSQALYTEINCSDVPLSTPIPVSNACSACSRSNCR